MSDVASDVKPLKKVIMYTDGACTGNPGPGGYGVVMIYGPHRKELSGGYRFTTNNRMEITAAIAGLRSLASPCLVELHTDSQYLRDSMTKGWVQRWRANGWKRNKKKKALNSDLWEKLLGLCNQHRVTFIWVKAHAGNAENERCDQLATTAARRRKLPPDIGYEQSQAVDVRGKSVTDPLL